MINRKVCVYIPVKNLYLEKDIAKYIRDNGYDLAAGINIAETPPIIQDYYRNYLTKVSIRKSVSGDFIFKQIDLVRIPNWSLRFDQSKKHLAGIEQIVLTLLRIVRLSNINSDVSFVLYEQLKSYFTSPEKSSFVIEAFTTAAATYSKSDLQTVTIMLNTYLLHMKSHKSLINTKIGVALEFYRRSLQYNDIFMKVVLYSVIFECLFSPGHHELSYQISENLAFFIMPEDNEQRFDIFKLIKQFYKIRSELVHTGSSKTIKKWGNLELLIIRDIIRKCLSKCLTDDKIAATFANDKKRIQYLQTLVIKR